MPVNKKVVDFLKKECFNQGKLKQEAKKMKLNTDKARKIMEKKKITQAELSRRMGWDDRQVANNYLAGHVKSVSLINRLGEALGVDGYDIMMRGR